GLPHPHLVAEAAQELFPDPTDLGQLLHRGEPAVLGAPVDDALGQHRSDPGQGVQRSGVSRVEVDHAITRTVPTPAGAGAGPASPTRTLSRRRLRSFSPLRLASASSSTEVNRPCSVRQSMMRSASTGPTPGKASNAAASAVLRSITPSPGPFPPPPAPAPAPPPDADAGGSSPGAGTYTCSPSTTGRA